MMLASLLVLGILVCAGSGAPSGASPPDSDLPVQTPWSFKATDKFCHGMVAKPKALTNTCNRNRTTLKCENGEYEMFSQMRQDYYVYTKHFSKLKRRGIYMDVAAHDPVHISNTFFMDACLGWSGVCVEANPGFLGALYKRRSCALVPTCVSDRDDKGVTFALHSGLSGVLETNKNVEAWKKKGIQVPTIKQTCTTMASVASKHRIKTVDYLSLDVEGHELLVLKGFDWDNIIVNVMTIETTPDSLPPIEDFLASKGYERHMADIEGARNGNLHEDAIFLHPTVVLGSPK